MTRIAVPVAGATLSAQVDGAAGKPWLLLSNSLAADLTMWDDQMDVLMRSHRVATDSCTAVPPPFVMTSSLRSRSLKRG